MTMTMNPDVRARFLPAGRLRASINLGNPILAGRDPKTNEPFGVSVDLARELAKRLDAELELVLFDAAGKSVQYVTDDKADFGFFAIDPLRGAGISFSDAYVLIEGAYLVPSGSSITSNDQVDTAGVRVAVGLGSAYDLYLTREIKNAELVRAPTSPAVVAYFLEHKLEVAAGVKQQLEMDTKGRTDVRLLPGRFMEIRQAMGIPKSRGAAAAAWLSSFVEEMKASGFVADALKRHHIEGASVAPPSDTGSRT